MNFSQRLGLTPAKKILQIDSIDRDLRNSLWNAFYENVLVVYNYFGLNADTKLKEVSSLLWALYFKLPVERAPDNFDYLRSSLSEKFEKFKWYEVYNFIEFTIDPSFVRSMDKYINDINFYLERENAGYRVINGIIVRITNELEVSAVEEALETSNFTAIKEVNTHLSQSLYHLSDKVNPDYRNAIKEAVSAVETAVRIITGESTLGKGLAKLESKGIQINAQLKESFNKIYAYSNAPDSGVRHSLIDSQNPPDYEIAKYLVVTSSAFINYLIPLANKAGFFKKV